MKLNLRINLRIRQTVLNKKNILFLIFLLSKCLYLRLKTQTSLINWDNLFINFIELHDAIFVVGALDETLILRGMRYHPVDIETTVIRSHKRICEW